MGTCGPRHGTLSSPTRRSADVIDLYSEAPVTGGRVLRFKVPFGHTTGFTFFRRHAAPMAPMSDHPIKSRALYLLS